MRNSKKIASYEGEPQINYVVRLMKDIQEWYL